MQPQPDFSWMIPVEVMLGALDHGEVHSCSISRVPYVLRDPDEDAYKPNMVSIGPWHRATTRQLLMMEEAKLRYMRDFLERRGTQRETRRSELRLRDCATDIIKMDKAIRACYGGGDMELDPHELSKMMIVDGCFLLELLLRLGDYINTIPSQQQNQNQNQNQGVNNNNTSSSSNNNPYLGDPLLEAKEKVLSVLNNITMLENQIPFVVLKKLYRNVFPDDSEIKHDHRVANIVHKVVFGYPSVNISGGAAHILHLMHLSTVEEQDQQEKKRGIKASQQLKRCATRLQAAGITIKPANSNTIGNVVSTSQYELVDIFNFNISFRENDKVLEIPPLRIKETTEVRWRNLIAWEQSRIWIKRMYTSYALFFQGLICCKHDIELLVKKRVIVIECKKSNEELLRLFRTISKGAEHMDPSYSKLCESLNGYQATQVVTKAFRELPIITWHKWWSVFEFIVFYGRNWYNLLIRDHIPTVWKFIGVVAAIALLVLTVMQTYYSSRSAG